MDENTEPFAVCDWCVAELGTEQDALIDGDFYFCDDGCFMAHSAECLDAED